MTPAEIIHAFGADSIQVLNGSAGDDLMNYYTGSADRVLVGWAGKDHITGGSGSDLLIGGDGADKFVFDLRQSGPASHDIVGDLDFTAGDRVQILVPSDSIILTGADSILSAEAAGEISVQTLANGGLEITVAADPGRVIELQSQKIAGIDLELYVLRFEKERMTLRVPTNKAESVGMRKLSSDKTLGEALDTLKGKPKVKRTMWSRRAQEYEAKINSGDIVAIRALGQAKRKRAP